jgi:hypothetical protein
VSTEPSTFNWCRILRLSSDADAAVLLTSGIVWRGGPETQLRAVAWLAEHVEVPLDSLTRLPDGVRAFVTAARA